MAPKKVLPLGLTERVLRAELTAHLGYPEGGERPPGDPDARNGTTPKTALTDDGALPLAIPRDRAGSFTPHLVPKGVRRLAGFDQQVLSLYARGLTVRELQAHLEECYQVPVSPDLSSAVTDEILPVLQAWHQRPLEAVYIAVVFDALRLKIRDEGVVQHKAVYLALGITASGAEEILGFWSAQTEGAAFWQRVISELQGRGVHDILIALIDGLTGFPAAIEAVFPQTVIHQCVVHLMRQGLTPVSWKDRQVVVPLLRAIYQGPGEAQAQQALAAFEAGKRGSGAGVLRVARDRSAMIVLVTLTTVASLLPLAIGTDPDSLFGSIALATAGGTVFGTLGAMFVLPALLAAGRPRRGRGAAGQV